MTWHRNQKQHYALRILWYVQWSLATYFSILCVYIINYLSHKDFSNFINEKKNIYTYIWRISKFLYLIKKWGPFITLKVLIISNHSVWNLKMVFKDNFFQFLQIKSEIKLGPSISLIKLEWRGVFVPAIKNLKFWT